MSLFCHSTKPFLISPVIFDTALVMQYCSKSCVNITAGMHNRLNLKVLFLQGCDCNLDMLAACFVSNCAEGSACVEQCLWSVFAMCAAWYKYAQLRV